MDDNEKATLEADAEALDRAALVAAYFAAESENEADAEQARHDENCLTRWAAFQRQRANS